MQAQSVMLPAHAGVTAHITIGGPSPLLKGHPPAINPAAPPTTTTAAAAAAAAASCALDAIEAQLSARGGLDACMSDMAALAPPELDPEMVERLVACAPTPTPGPPPAAPGAHLISVSAGLSVAPAPI